MTDATQSQSPVAEEIESPDPLRKRDAYVAVQETEPCKRCGGGETWSVKGPDGAFIGQSWDGDDAECNAEETAQMLNAAWESGYRAGTADQSDGSPQ